MKEFKIIEHWVKANFEKGVKEALEQGWELYGNLCIHGEPGKQKLYIQAMVKIS